MRRYLAGLIIGAGVAAMPSGGDCWQATVDVPPVSPAVLGSNGLDLTTVSNGIVAAGAYRFVVVRLSPTDGSEVWRYDAGPGHAARVRFDGAGAVVAAGQVGAAFTVAKLDAASGMEAWRTDIVGTVDSSDAADVAIDAAGDVIAAGKLGNAGADAVVVKLSGLDGGELWRHVVDGGASSEDEATAVRLDPSGNAVTLGRLGASGPTVSTIFALDAGTGMELWRDDFPDPYVIGGFGGRGIASIALDDAGDVAAIGQTLPGGVPVSVYLLSGVDGDQLWRTDLPEAASVVPVAEVAFLASGDVLASDSQLGVAVLARSDGHERWRRILGCGQNDVLDALTEDPDGDVIVLGRRPDCSPGRQSFTIAKLAGDDGSDVWTRDYAGQPTGSFTAHAVDVLPTGDVLAVGSVVVGVNVPFRTSITAFTVLDFSASEGALEVCGDGYRDAGEGCDDGNTLDGDCCASTCQPVPDGTTCDDHNRCTSDDMCRGGACQGGPPLACEPCGTCDPLAGCVTALPFSCLTPTASQRAIVRLAKGGRGGNAIAWEWGSGAATTRGDFGDPRRTTAYALCVFGNGASSLVRAAAPAGARCSRTTGCWRKTDTGFVYRSPSGRPDGISHIALRAGRAGKAKIVVRGRGRALALPALPPSMPLTVQLRKVDGSPPCWSAEHAFVIRSEAHRFSARGD